VIACEYDFPALNSLYGEAEARITNPQPRRVSIVYWQLGNEGVALDWFASAFTYAWEFTALIFCLLMPRRDPYYCAIWRSVFYYIYNAHQPPAK
jgi:hypothetical protein